MAPNAAMQMALANLLRGGLPQRMASGMGPPPIDSSLPGLPGMDGMAPQMAIADALSGRVGAAPSQAVPPPMGDVATPPAGQVPPALTVSQSEAEDPEGMDFAQAMSDALDSQRAVAGSLSRQRAVGNLGLLTGDRVLSNFGRAQLEQAETGDPNSLRYLSLVQAQQRLKQQADAEKRRAGQVDRKFEYDKEQDKLKREGALAKIKADAAAAQAKAAKNAEKDALEREADLNKATTGLRKEFNDLPAVKGYDTVAGSYETLRNSYTDMTGPGAINTIFSFMKIIDPGVSVMGGDVELIRNSGGAAAKYAGMLDSALKGNPLTAATRNDLFRQATAQYESRRKQYEDAQRKYDQIARRQKVDPNLIFLDRDDIRIGGKGGGTTPTGAPPRTTPGSLPTGPDGNPTLDTPAPAAGAASQDDLPPLVSTRGMKPGDLAKSVEEGKRIRIRAPGGGFTTFEKRNGKLFKVSGN